MRRLVLLLTGIIWLTSPVTWVLADVAPPAQVPGANPQPGSEVTEVRMMSETVTIEIQEDTPDGSLGQARVTANFIMRNLGDTAESMAVRFPISSSDGFGGYPEISDLQVKVDGKTVAVTRIEGEDPRFGGETVPWVAFDATFAPAVDVTIQVAYTLEASGDVPNITFYYIFSTGAAWKDTIGSATLFVRFPYEISALNVLPSASGEVFPDHQLSGSELQWVFTDFEPEAGDNFEITIVAPEVWQQVLRERQNVEKNRDDGEAWGRLAKLYKELAFSPRGKGFRTYSFLNDQGAQELYELSVAAYEKALERKPFDPLWHAGYAHLLSYYAFFANFEGIDARAETVRSLQEIKTALELDDKDDKVREIAAMVAGLSNGGMVEAGQGYDYPWLTATPTVNAQSIIELETTPTVEITPTQGRTLESVEVTVTPQPTAEKSSTKVPLCGSLILAPFALMVGIVTRKRNR